VTLVVIDASAGVELLADTSRGRALRRLLPAGAVPWVPDHFYVECAGVLRRWELTGRMRPPESAQALADLEGWHLRTVQVRPLLADAWRLRANVSIADGLYVALAKHLGAPLLTDDHRLANTTPQLPIATLHLP
jgi:predicted nucleic acid-binding protein